MVQLWRADLSKINPRAAEALADPAQYANLFPNMDLAVKAEQYQVGAASLWAMRLCGVPLICIAPAGYTVAACAKCAAPNAYYHLHPCI